MTVERTKELIDELMKEDNVEIGIFISLLSYNFMKKSGLPQKAFIKSLKNSLKICKKEGY